MSNLKKYRNRITGDECFVRWSESGLVEIEYYLCCENSKLMADSYLPKFAKDNLQKEFNIENRTLDVTPRYKSIRMIDMFNALYVADDIFDGKLVDFVTCEWKAYFEVADSDAEKRPLKFIIAFKQQIYDTYNLVFYEKLPFTQSDIYSNYNKGVIIFNSMNKKDLERSIFEMFSYRNSLLIDTGNDYPTINTIDGIFKNKAMSAHQIASRNKLFEDAINSMV